MAHPSRFLSLREGAGRVNVGDAKAGSPPAGCASIPVLVLLVIQPQEINASAFLRTTPGGARRDQFSQGDRRDWVDSFGLPKAAFKLKS